MTDYNDGLARVERGAGMSDTPFAERLRALMGARRLTMQSVASACGVTPQAVHKWTTRKAMPNSHTMLIISRIGECSIEWLMCPQPIDWQSTGEAPQGRHAKYWIREALIEMKSEGLL